MELKKLQKYLYKGFVSDTFENKESIVYKHEDGRKIFTYGRWIYGYPSFIPLIPNSEKAYIDDREVISQSVCMCTGMKDRNRTPIFEHDKVKVYDKITGYVIYKQGCFFIEIQEKIKQPLFHFKAEELQVTGIVDCFE